MSQGPVPPRYPPPLPQQRQQAQPQIPQPYPQQPSPQQPYSQQPPALTPAYPPTQQDGFLVNVPGQVPAQPQGAPAINYYSATQEYSGGIWNYGGTLVMHKQAQLPPQCIKCCAPIEGQPLKRKVYWHPS